MLLLPILRGVHHLTRMRLTTRHNGVDGSAVISVHLRVIASVIRLLHSHVVQQVCRRTVPLAAPVVIRFVVLQWHRCRVLVLGALSRIHVLISV